MVLFPADGVTVIKSLTETYLKGYTISFSIFYVNEMTTMRKNVSPGKQKHLKMLILCARNFNKTNSLFDVVY